MFSMELEMVRAWVTDRIAALRAEDGDRGNMTSETVIWIAVIVVAAIAIGAIIVAKSRRPGDSSSAGPDPGRPPVAAPG
jgi:hypothetical protein